MPDLGSRGLWFGASGWSTPGVGQLIAPGQGCSSVHCSFLGHTRPWNKSSPCPSSWYFLFWSSIGKKYLATEINLVSLCVWPFWWIIQSSCCLLSVLQMPCHGQSFFFCIFVLSERNIFQRFAVNYRMIFVQYGDWMLLPAWKHLYSTHAKHVIWTLI